TTVIGIFSIFALFQIFVFVGVPINCPVYIYIIVMGLIFAFAPILCTVLRVDIKLKRNDISGFLFAFCTVVFLVMLSKPFNTGAMFFDSNYYLSKVIESSVSNVFGHVSNYSGSYLYRFDTLYDFQGYYYFWGIILKLVRNMIIDSNISLTPIYIWSASLTYYLSLGYLAFMSCQILFKKNGFKIIVPILFIIPYFTNYYNTTLGFFGNSIKVISVGLCLLVIKLWFENKELKLLYILPILYLSGLSFSSSSFYLFIFIIISFFFTLIFTNESNALVYKHLIISSLPIVIYAIFILTGWEMDAPLIAIFLFAIYIISLGIILILAKCSKEVLINVIKGFKIIFYLLLVLLVAGSFILRSGQFGYDFYFELRSLNDMTLNYTNNVNLFELMRNIGLWSFIGLLIISSKLKKDQELKLVLICILALFLNPFTMPVIATYITGIVYSRTFELLVNPFILVYLVSLIGTIKSKKIQIVFRFFVVLVSSILIINTIQQPYSRILLNDENYNWEYKLSTNEYNMINALTDEVVSNGLERPLILSQSFNVKGYVPNIRMYFSSQDLRDALENEVSFKSNEFKDAITLFYPRIYIYDEIFGEKPNYDNLCPVITDSNSDYVIMKTTLIYPNENGDFVPIWWNARACSDAIYDNEEWVILKVRK
ncbi:MAG: hypothetical protein RR623_04645, partial [Bacilli bacterium]